MLDAGKYAIFSRCAHIQSSFGSIQGIFMEAAKEKFRKSIKIGSWSLPGDGPFIVAELSGNHHQSIDNAIKLIDAAADAGCHAIKLQTYTADTMTFNEGQAKTVIDDPNSLWHGYSLHELYSKAFTPWEWHEKLFDYAKEKGMIAFSTPFDKTAIDFLAKLNVPCFKIASFENGDTGLIRGIASAGKPVIMSTGMAPIGVLEESVKLIRECGCEDLVLLKCTSSYPAPVDASNLRTLPHLRDMFGVPVGLSDHTLGIAASVVSVAFGACLIEKHLVLDRSAGGVDAAFSLEPQEMKSLVHEVRNAWLALGEISYGPTRAEEGSVIFRRSLFTVKDIEAGEEFTLQNVRSIRPGNGLNPKFADIVYGRRAHARIPKGTPLSWDLLLGSKKSSPA